MVIVVAIAGVAVPQFSRSMIHVQLRKNTQEISAFLRDARNTAITESRMISIMLDSDDQSLRIEDEEATYRWPEDIRVDVPNNEASFLQTDTNIRFYPDGTATNSTLTISARDRSHTIAVDWLTGRVRVL